MPKTELKHCGRPRIRPQHIEVQTIRYKDEDTNRVVIPAFVPLPHMKALDVTELSPEDQQQLAEQFKEYAEYYETAALTLFSFEDWLSHTQGDDVQVQLKWRTFVLENTEIVD